MAIAALIISILSLILSVYIVFIDRPRLRIESAFWPDSEWSAATLQVTIVNRGRRPAILLSYGGSDDEGEWSSTYFKDEHGGIRLGENERHVLRITAEGAIAMNPDGPDIIFSTMWIEDSLGNRHAIPDSRRHLAALHP